MKHGVTCPAWVTRDEWEWLEIYFGTVHYVEEVFEFTNEGRIQSLARVVRTDEGERFIHVNRNAHDVRESDDFLPNYDDYIPIVEDYLWVEISKITPVRAGILQVIFAEGGRAYISPAPNPPYKPIIYHHCCVFRRETP